MGIVVNYTTSISATKTIGEIQKLLVSHGATRVAVDYESERAVGVTFTLVTPHGPRVFTLPVDVQAMSDLLIAERRAGRLQSISQKAAHSMEHAERVAWRVIKDWLAAQLSLVASQMASLDQVMLPYLHVEGEKTLYAAYKAQESRTLELMGGSDA